MFSPFIATTFQNTVKDFRAHCPRQCVVGTLAK